MPKQNERQIAPETKDVWVRVDELDIHPTAQRLLLPSKVNEIYNNLDLDAIGVLHAVEYEINGVRKIWIIDGQHRWRALMNHDFGEWSVKVRVHGDVKDDARACALFLKLNNRRAIGPYDKFEKSVRSGDASAVGILRLTSERQLRITRSTESDGTIRCVSALGTVYAADGGAALRKTLDTLLGAWGRKTAAYDGKLVEGVGRGDD